MKKLHDDMMALDMGRVGRNYAVFALVAVVICGALGAFLLWPQLSAGWSMVAGGSGPLAWRLEGLEDAFEWSLAGYDNATLGAVSLGARTALVVMGLVLVFVAAGYWLLVALWLYQAAERAEMGGAFWLLLGLIGNLAAVCAFVALRSVLRVRCNACDGWVAKDAVYCHLCGEAIAANCQHCGAALGGSDHYCSSCGTVVNK